jgi:hypothetical protein
LTYPKKLAVGKKQLAKSSWQKAVGKMQKIKIEVIKSGLKNSLNRKYG